jgi:hypothetical protein
MKICYNIIGYFYQFNKLMSETLTFNNFWETVTPEQLRRDPTVKDFVAIYQPDLIWEGIKGLRELENSEGKREEIARRLAVLLEINISDPRLISASHSFVGLRRLKRILEADNHFQTNSSSELYRDLISDLENENGLLRNLIDLIQKNREEKGIATPFSTEILVEALAKEAGIDKSFTDLTQDDWQKVLLDFNNIPAEIIYQRLLSSTNPYYIWTITGIGRNLAVLPVFQKEWGGGTYVDVGGSVGVNAFEIGERVGFSRVFSLDKMSEEEALAITQITDFQQGRPIAFDDNLRRKVNEEVKFIWGFDATKDNLAEKIPGSILPPLVIGIHNLLVHLINKIEVILNALNTIGNDGFLWISGGFIANSPVLYNFILTIEGVRVVDVFVDQYDGKNGGDGKRVDSREKIKQIFLKLDKREY